MGFEIHDPVRIKVLRKDPNVRLPELAHDTDACFDFFVPKAYRLYANRTTVLPLGISVVLPTGFWLQFEEKSGLASKGVMIGGSVIDEGYRGELAVIIRYLPPHVENYPLGASYMNNTFDFMANDKIVQGRLVRRITTEIVEIDEEAFSGATSRGVGGFGSTGR